MGRGTSITRTSEDACQLASRNLAAERGTLTARVRKIEARLAVPAGTRAGRLAGYATPAERHGKTIRLKALKARLARVERTDRLERYPAGGPPVVLLGVLVGLSAEPGRSSASRLLAVLGAFDRRRPAMNLTRLSNISGLSLATTHRIVKELTEWGALEKNPDGTLQIGLRLWEIGSLAPRQRDLRHVARPILDNLHEATKEIVQLAVLEDGYALVVEKVSGSRSVSNVTEIAGRLPLHATGVGKVFLFFGPDELMEQARTGILKRFTERTVTNPAAIANAARKAQHEFVTYCQDEMTAGTSSVAAPVFDAEGDLVAALGVLFPSRGPVSRLAPAVLTAAMAISRRMDYFGPMSSGDGR